MSDRNTIPSLRKIKWRVVGTTCSLITILSFILHFYRNVALRYSIFGWLLAIIIACVVIIYLYDHLEKLHGALNEKVVLLEKQAQRDAALAQFSKGFPAPHQNETQICDEVVERLRAVQGYDYVAVFLVDQVSGNRILCAEVLKGNIPSIHVLQPGEGLSERPMLDGKLHYSPDISQEASHVLGLPQGSEIDIPIIFEDDVMGIIVVESSETNAFDSFDFEILTIIAGQAALAIKNARLLNAEKSRRHQAEILYRTTSTLTSALELDQVLDEILDQLKQVIKHDSACIFIQEENSLVAMAAHGLAELDKVVNERFPVDNKFFQLVYKHEHPVILNDVNTDLDFRGWGGTHQTRSWMGIPLIFLDRVIGLLTLDSLQASAYDESQANLALIFANQATIAIENARIYRSARDTVDRQKLLHQLSQEIIRAGIDLEQIYQSVHNTTAQLMPADSFVISILDENSDEILAAYLYDKGVRGEPMRIPRGQGLSGYIIETGKPFLAYDYFQQEDLQVLNVVHFGSEEHIRSVLAVPMRLGDKVIGMLSAQTYQSYDYSTEDQQLLDMLAAYAAIGINNARLFAKVQRLAITDSLTGTYNRRYFYNAAQTEINRSRRYGHPVSVLMLDIDDFKEINDTLGHDVGDQALQLIAHRCQENIRDADILARYGGDEFIILLPETNAEQALEIAERLRGFLENHPIKIGSAKVNSTVSIGVAGSDNAPAELDVFLKCADMALYEAKQSGRNCIIINPCISNEIRKAH